MTTTSWVTLISSIVGLISVLIGVSLTIRHNARTNRANLFSNYRLKWIDLFRDELSRLLILGQRLYEPSLQTEEAERKPVLTELWASRTQLIVLLGREDHLRLSFAELVREFASSPTPQLSERLEVEAQKVFRDAWNRVREDTGKPARVKAPLDRPQSPARSPTSHDRGH